jgi:hypothetical protein
MATPHPAGGYNPEAQISIDAPASVVWQVLQDLPHYPDWSTFVTAIDCKNSPAQVGDELTLHVALDAGASTSTTKVTNTTVTPPTTDANGVTTAFWYFEYSGVLHKLCLLNGLRLQELRQEQPDGPTIYHTWDHLTGCLGCCSGVTRVTAGFQRQAADLKKRAEALKAQHVSVAAGSK